MNEDGPTTRSLYTLIAVTAIVFLALLLWAVADRVQGEDGIVTVTACQEDEVIRGIGDFDTGMWTAYVCVHPDTLAQP